MPLLLKAIAIEARDLLSQNHARSGFLPNLSSFFRNAIGIIHHVVSREAIRRLTQLLRVARMLCSAMVANVCPTHVCKDAL